MRKRCAWAMGIVLGAWLLQWGAGFLVETFLNAQAIKTTLETQVNQALAEGFQQNNAEKQPVACQFTFKRLHLHPTWLSGLHARLEAPQLICRQVLAVKGNGFISLQANRLELALRYGPLFSTRKLSVSRVSLNQAHAQAWQAEKILAAFRVPKQQPNLLDLSHTRWILKQPKVTWNHVVLHAQQLDLDRWQPEEPLIQGRLLVQKLSVLGKLPEKLSLNDVTGNLTLMNGQLSIPMLKGRLNQQPVMLAGRLQLPTLNPEKLAGIQPQDWLNHLQSVYLQSPQLDLAVFKNLNTGGSASVNLTFTQPAVNLQKHRDQKHTDLNTPDNRFYTTLLSGLSGTIHFQNAWLKANQALPNVYHLNGQLGLKNGQLHWHDLSGELSGGNIASTGQVDLLAPGQPLDAQLSMVFRDVQPTARWLIANQKLVSNPKVLPEKIFYDTISLQTLSLAGGLSAQFNLKGHLKSPQTLWPTGTAAFKNLRIQSKGTPVWLEGIQGQLALSPAGTITSQGLTGQLSNGQQSARWQLQAQLQTRRLQTNAEKSAGSLSRLELNMPQLDLAMLQPLLSPRQAGQKDTLNGQAAVKLLAEASALNTLRLTRGELQLQHIMFKPANRPERLILPMATLTLTPEGTLRLPKTNFQLALSPLFETQKKLETQKPEGIDVSGIQASILQASIQGEIQNLLTPAARLHAELQTTQPIQLAELQGTLNRLLQANNTTAKLSTPSFNSVPALRGTGLLSAQLNGQLYGPLKQQPELSAQVQLQQVGIGSELQDLTGTVSITHLLSKLPSFKTDNLTGLYHLNLYHLNQANLPVTDLPIRLSLVGNTKQFETHLQTTLPQATLAAYGKIPEQALGNTQLQADYVGSWPFNSKGNGSQTATGKLTLSLQEPGSLNYWISLPFQVSEQQVRLLQHHFDTPAGPLFLSLQIDNLKQALHNPSALSIQAQAKTLEAFPINAFPVAQLGHSADSQAITTSQAGSQQGRPEAASSQPTPPQGNIMVDLAYSQTPETGPLLSGHVDCSELSWLDAGVQGITGQVRFDGVQGTLRFPHIQLNGLDTGFSADVVDWTLFPLALEHVEITGNTFVMSEFESWLKQIGPKLSETFKLPSVPVALPSFKQASTRFNEIIYKNIILQQGQGQLSMYPSGLIEFQNAEVQVANGVVKGFLSLNARPTENFITVALNAEKIEANALARALLNAPNQIFGRLSGSIRFTTEGTTDEELLNHTNGTADFVIKDGRLPAIARVESLLAAANVLRGGLAGLNLNNIFRALSPLESNYFAELSGGLQLADGLAYTNNLLSDGEDLDLLIQGNVRLQDGYGKLKVNGTMSQDVRGALGVLGKLSLSRAVQFIPGLGFLPGHSRGLLSWIPGLGFIPGLGGTPKDTNAFRVTIDGPLDQQSSVKRFEWR